jgi:hypothetical protein
VSDIHRQRDRGCYVVGFAGALARQSELFDRSDAALVDTFFEGSTEKVVAALLGGYGAHLSEQELGRIADLVTKVRKEGPR